MSRDVVLVTDGEQRASLAAVRSLGGSGYEVHVCSERGRSLAGASRRCSGETAVPNALHEPARFVDAVDALARRTGVRWILPMTEPALLALLPARARLAPAGLPFPDAAAFRRISDKQELLAAAPRAGIAVPMQHVLRDADDAREFLDGAVRFPLVLKPARSVGEENGRRVRHGVVHVHDLDGLRAALANLPSSAYPLLAQQRIEGPGVGVFLLVWDARPVAVFCHRRLREKPPSGGVSVYRESIARDDALVAKSAALLSEFGWRGVAMVEYKIERSTGVPYLMEVNGRFWGSLQLAIDAGVDFPALLLQAASGAAMPETPAYRVGVRSRWWWGDVDHLLLRLRRGSAELALPADAPGRLGAVAEFMTWRRADRDEVFRVRDPWPFAHETWQWMRGR